VHTLDEPHVGDGAGNEREPERDRADAVLPALLAAPALFTPQA